jgi:alkylation response protein AidB-like acyl-CoA dehydrogenase
MGRRDTRDSLQAMWFANDTIQMYGAYGYSNEYDVERYLRNSKGAVVHEGTSQIHTLMQAGYALGQQQDWPLRCELPTYDPDEWQK